MLYSLKGNVISKENDFICLEVNNFGFKIYTYNIKNIDVDEPLTLFIYDLIKEDQFILCGFYTIKELLLFKKIIGVNGVGYKTTLQLFNRLSSDEIIYLIKNNDAKRLSELSGIGVKANNIVFELKRKIDEFESIYLFEYENVYKTLVSFGFNNKEINSAISKIPSGYNDQKALKECLRILNNGIK